MLLKHHGVQFAFQVPVLTSITVAGWNFPNFHLTLIIKVFLRLETIIDKRPHYNISRIVQKVIHE